MKLSVFSPVFNGTSLEDMLKTLHEKGVQAVELGTGGFPGTDHINPDNLIDKPDEIKKIQDLLVKYEIEICAFSCHGNAVHPDKKVAEKANSDFEKTCILAEQMGIDTVITLEKSRRVCKISRY